MFIPVYIGMYIFSIENTLCGGCCVVVLLLLFGWLVVFSAVWSLCDIWAKKCEKAHKKFTKLQHSTRLSAPTLLFLLQNCVCVSRSSITVFICLNLPVCNKELVANAFGNIFRLY